MDSNIQGDEGLGQAAWFQWPRRNFSERLEGSQYHLEFILEVVIVQKLTLILSPVESEARA